MSQEDQTISREEKSKDKQSRKKSENHQELKPSKFRVTMGVTAASAAGVFAVSLLGVGPVLVAGTAGYLAYQGMTGVRS